MANGRERSDEVDDDEHEEAVRGKSLVHGERDRQEIVFVFHFCRRYS